MEDEYRLYLGTYTGAETDAAGIGLVSAESGGTLRPTGEVAATCDPSFLAAAPDGRTVFAVNELLYGRVVAFEVLPGGALHEINSQSSLGAAPCHLSVHPSGRFLLTANYLSGNLVVHPIAEGGVLREPCHVVQHSGSGPNHDRQAGPHAHQILPDPGGRYVLAVDLGTDSIYVYDFDTDTGHLALKEEVVLRAGAGPRHVAFHPWRNRLYVINELASTMTECDYDPETGWIGPGRTLSTLPEGYAGHNLGSEVVLSPDGRFAVGSNRGHDSLAIFSTGDEFRLLGVYSARVAEPRHISFAPDGRILFAAGQNSATVQPFEIGESGEPAPIGEPFRTPCPVCVLPVPIHDHSSLPS